MKVMVSVCSNRSPEWSMVKDLYRAMDCARSVGYQVYFDPPQYGICNIAFARQGEIAKFLQSPCQWFFMTEDDVTIPKDAIPRLISVDANIVSGAVRGKTPDGKIAAVIDENLWSYNKALKTNAVIPATYVGAGCLLISRYAIEMMVKVYDHLKYDHWGMTAYGLFMPEIENGVFYPTDYAFCRRARWSGISDIFLHCGVQCTHWGKMPFGFDDDRKYKSIQPRRWLQPKAKTVFSRGIVKGGG